MAAQIRFESTKLDTDLFAKDAAEDLKKEIKRLEQEIDSKLLTYSSFSDRYEQWDEPPSSSLASIELQGLLDKVVVSRGLHSQISAPRV